MTQPKFQTSRKAKEAGWFSRRHETNAANREARERWFATKSKDARRARAEERAARG